MLIDSGADETLLPSWIAEALGLVPTGERVQLFSFAGESVLGDVAEVRLTFGGGAFDLATRAVFHPSIGVPCLGNRDFFRQFRVTFDAGRGIFEIERAALH